MGRFISPYRRKVGLAGIGKDIGRVVDTLTVFEPLLNHRIVDICQNLQVLQMHVHCRQSSLFHLLPALLLRQLLRNLGNAFPLLFYLGELLGAVGSKDFARFLKALVGELLKGDAGSGM